MPHHRPTYPPSRRGDIIETYHGIAVADPYRWLEDAESAETTAWVDAQNDLTRSMVSGPVRDALVERLTMLYDYPRTSAPIKRGERLFFAHNTGLQNQPVFYVRDGSRAPRVLLDPNTLSPDGTIALTAVEPDEAGRFVAYGLSASGSDRQDILIRDVAADRDLDDRLLWTKFVSIAWLNDGTGFYYTRFPDPGTVPAGQEQYFCRVYFHRLGDSQADDALVFERPDQPDVVFHVDVSDDDRWTVLTAHRGANDRSEVYLIDRASGSAATPLFTGFDSAWMFVESAAGHLLFRTDADAPRGRIVTIDPHLGKRSLTEVVAESPSDTLLGALVANQQVVALYLHNASNQIRVFELSGTAAGGIDLPEIGSVSALTGRPDDNEIFLTFTSFTRPPTSLRVDLTTRNREAFQPGIEEAPRRGAVTPSGYETEQVWYPSTDGTPISMFLVRRRGLPRDGLRPVLLTGYGGFNICLTPAFDPANFVLLDAGGMLAVTNLRGGGEYGEAWHQAGMLDRKQNVFDDFIAAAEWLVSAGWTRPQRLAIEGGSNGGLLVSAVTIQRPELFGAMICRVPVADMLRYHLFTVGRYWIPEYGSADDPQQFAGLYKYSPYHNVSDDARYPPILITTADTDDRVSPGMAKKLAARLQAATTNEAPVLIRVETRAGHGAGKPVAKMIEEDADIFAFLFAQLGIER